MRPPHAGLLQALLRSRTQHHGVPRAHLPLPLAPTSAALLAAARRACACCCRCCTLCATHTPSVPIPAMLLVACCPHRWAVAPVRRPGAAATPHPRLRHHVGARPSRTLRPHPTLRMLAPLSGCPPTCSAPSVLALPTQSRLLLRARPALHQQAGARHRHPASHPCVPLRRRVSARPISTPAALHPLLPSPARPWSPLACLNAQPATRLSHLSCHAQRCMG